VIVAYGSSDYAPTLAAETLKAGQPLRFNNSRYDVDELTEKARTGTVTERLDFLRDYHETLCGTYAKRPRQFVALYFRLIDTILAADRPALEKKAAGFGGLFTWQDYAFSALRPLPQAFLPVGDSHPKTDFAFWTGKQVVVIDIAGDTRGPGWIERCRRLNDAGMLTIEPPISIFVKNDPAALRDLLQPEFSTFWQSEAMPSSPFKATALGDIVAGEPEF
jgi:hypothetical protein